MTLNDVILGDRLSEYATLLVRMNSARTHAVNQSSNLPN